MFASKAMTQLLSGKLNEFCEIEVRHILKRKNCFLIFSFQTATSYSKSTYGII